MPRVFEKESNSSAVETVEVTIEHHLMVGHPFLTDGHMTTWFDKNIRIFYN